MSKFPVWNCGVWSFNGLKKNLKAKPFNFTTILIKLSQRSELFLLNPFSCQFKYNFGGEPGGFAQQFKSTCYSHRGCWFNFQHSHGSSQSSCLQLQGIWPLLAPGTHTHGVHAHMQTTHTYYTHTYTYIQIHIHIVYSVNAYMCICMFMYIYIHIEVYINVYKYTYIGIYARIYSKYFVID